MPQKRQFKALFHGIAFQKCLAVAKYVASVCFRRGARSREAAIEGIKITGDSLAHQEAAMLRDFGKGTCSFAEASNFDLRPYDAAADAVVQSHRHDPWDCFPGPTAFTKNSADETECLRNYDAWFSTAFRRFK